MDEINQTKAIAEFRNFIVLEKHTKIDQTGSFQTEAELEKELINDLCRQGYEYVNYLVTHEALLSNLRQQLENLNHVTFTDVESGTYLSRIY